MWENIPLDHDRGLVVGSFESSALAAISTGGSLLLPGGSSLEFLGILIIAKVAGRSMTSNKS